MTAAHRGSALAVARELVDRLGVSRAASVADSRMRDSDRPAPGLLGLLATPAARYWAAVWVAICRIAAQRHTSAG